MHRRDLAALAISHEEAEQYVPFGCGEYVMVGYSVGTPNNGINALKALEIALHNRPSISTRTFPAAKDRRPGAVDTFEKLYDAVLAQLKPTS